MLLETTVGETRLGSVLNRNTISTWSPLRVFTNLDLYFTPQTLR